MAVKLVKTFLASAEAPSIFRKEWAGISKQQELLTKGLQEARWPGRCQRVEDRYASRKGVRWYLDGAHTVESLQCCADWFASELNALEE